MLPLIQKSFVMYCVKFWLCEWIELKQIPDALKIMFTQWCFFHCPQTNSGAEWNLTEIEGLRSVCIHLSRHVKEGAMIASVFLLPSKENVFLLPQVSLRNSALTFMGLGFFFPTYLWFLFLDCAELQYTMTTDIHVL